ncbi:hypothetical protein [Bradyrhizobium arachidis]|uniref:hypothetical protein n=1 Tax=Bradyrhizobium arachidis TaxID=858423 RepID=UPI001160135D|nr:hypothetical protein [Bradyrhizobium arachidis]
MSLVISQLPAVQVSQSRKAGGLHMQDRQRRGKQGLSVTDVTTVRSGDYLARCFNGLSDCNGAEMNLSVQAAGNAPFWL